MIPPRSILVATDHSAAGAAALRWGESAARRFDATLHVVYSCDVQRLALLPGAIATPDEFWTRLRGGAEKVLADACGEASAAGVECVTHLAQTEPSAAIVECAEEVSADLIAMGTHGHRGPSRWMLGSTAERTIRTAPCPVVTIRDADRVKTAGFDRLVVGLDFSKPADRALDAAKALALATNAQVFLVHADYVPVELQGWVASGRAAGTMGRLSAEGDRRLEEAAASLRDAGILVESMKPQGEPDRVLEKVATEVDASLVIVGTHGRTGLTRVVLGSVAERVARTSPCPVLSISPDAR